MLINKLTNIGGILVIILILWIFSESRRKFPFRIVIWGLAIQFLLAVFILYIPAGVKIFEFIGNQVRIFLNYSIDSAKFLFGNLVNSDNKELFGVQIGIIITVTVVFFSSFVSMLYHLGIIQKIVYYMAWLMHKTMRTSGVESLSASANVFVGQTEAPLLVRHYLPVATRSELFSIMTGGFATIAGGVMAAYIAMGISPRILISASLISAPGSLVLSKILIPPVSGTKTLSEIKDLETPKSDNIMAAITQGAADGMKLSINILAMLIAFIALIALTDSILGFIGSLLTNAGMDFFPSSLKELFGYIFQPFAYLAGVPANEASTFGSLLGTKTGLNEFLAYADLSEMVRSGAISHRTAQIASFALCGFANFGSVAIQIGGIGVLVPEKRSLIASLGIKAMLAGALVNIMTAVIAGIFI